ncbi:PLD nuclease N-terminal domain-containing protein [Mariniflexile sp.]|uniref:PLD nuclease N-terminal domain-containing protein n=1 Tax=Mariniflexile sp. TaxID=1979402 RepID=UPI003565AD0C
MQNFVIQFILGLSIALWIWTLMDFSQSKFKNFKYKMGWLLFITLFPILGAILYFQLKKNSNISDYEVN